MNSSNGCLKFQTSVLYMCLYLMYPLLLKLLFLTNKCMSEITRKQATTKSAYLPAVLLLN